MNYLVMVDDEGRLCWKKNGLRIDTTAEWRDSVNGIVPMGDETPEFSPAAGEVTDSKRPDHSSSEGSCNGSLDENGSKANDVGSANEDLKGARRFKKSKQVAPAAVYEHLLMKPAKKKSKWIFVSVHTHILRNLSSPQADEISWNMVGCRHIEQFIRRHEATRRLSTLLLPPRLSHICCRAHQNQSRSDPKYVPILRLYSTIYCLISFLDHTLINPPSPISTPQYTQPPQK